MNLICNDKKKFNFSKAIKTLKYWKNKNYCFKSSEFQYVYIKRKIFAETFLCDELIDYKIFCFNGEPKFIRLRKIIEWKIIKKIHNHYNIDWKLNKLESNLIGYVRDPKVKIDKPKHLDLMLKYSKLLSQEFVFVRVDFYEVKNEIYLGELTLSPSNSFLQWKNIKQNAWF